MEGLKIRVTGPNRTKNNSIRDTLVEFTRQNYLDAEVGTHWVRSNFVKVAIDGPPASGKSGVARFIFKHLKERGFDVVYRDGGVEIERHDVPGSMFHYQVHVRQ